MGKENLFYNQYERLNSYFTNSGMEATGLPQGRELEILEQYRGRLPESVLPFRRPTPFTPIICRPGKTCGRRLRC